MLKGSNFQIINKGEIIMSTTNTNDKVIKALKLDENMTKNAKGETLSSVLKATNLESLMGTGAPRATFEEVLEMDANMDWLEEVAQAIQDTAYKYQNQWNDAMTPELLAVYLRWVILNRINFLENGRNAVHPKNVSYPTLMYDALCRITRYDGAVRDGAQIIPSVGPAEISAQEAEVINAWIEAYTGTPTTADNTFTATSWIDEQGRVIAFPGHDNLERLLRIAGVEMATGLPMTRKSTIRTMFEMSVDQDEYVTTAGQAPTVADVFSRCFYEFEALTNLIGVQKVELLLYHTLKSKLLDITEGYVKNFRG